MVSERVLSLAFVGRVPELDHLAVRRRDANQGRGGVILIAGEAGVGKSRLVNEFRRRFASGAAGSLVTAGCRPFAQRPLDPVAAVLEQLGDSALAQDARTWSSREALFDAILDAFARAAAKRARTVILEDLHWADLELIQLLTILAERAPHQRLLVIGTYRDNEVVPSSPIFTAFGHLTREPAVTLLALEPLRDSEFGEFLRSLLSQIDVTVPSHVLEDVRRRSGGNPLFTEELMRCAVDAQRAGTTTSHALPISLRAVIRERLDRCSVDERALLSQASVFGRRFHLDLLGAVFGFDETAASPALKHLRELQLIDGAEQAVGSNVYEFRHALTRDAIYGELLPSQAQRLHERVAEIVEQRPDAERHVELLAHSFWEAGHRDRAAPHCERAAEEAARMHAYDDAVFWFERAGEGFGGGLSAGRCVSKAAFGAVRLHDPDRAVRLHERAIRLYEDCGAFSDAVRISNSLAGTLFNNGQSQKAIALMRSSIELAVRSGVAALQRDVSIRLFSAFAALRRVPEALEQAGTIDETTLDHTQNSAGEYYLARSSLHAQLGEVERWRHNFTNGLEVLVRTDVDRFVVRYAHGSIARQALDLGEMESAREHVQIGLELARELRADEAYMISLLTEIDLRAGNLAPLRERMRTLPPSREFLARQSVAATTVALALHLGDDELLRSAVDVNLVEEAETGGNRFAVVTLATAFGLALRRLGRNAEAMVLLARATEGVSGSYGHVAEVSALALATPASAAKLREIVERDPSASRLRNALLDLLTAIDARENGDDRAARSAGAAAATAFAAVGWPLLEARSREVTGDRDGALAVYRRVAAFGDVRRLERAPAALNPAARARRSVLTPRELDVARLVATGKGNRAIAEALSISHKAVEKYLTSTYEKLGISSRAQLAVYMAAGAELEPAAALAGSE